MTPEDKLILKTALDTLRRTGNRGMTWKNLINLVETDTDMLLTTEQAEALRKMLHDRQYVRTYNLPVTGQAQTTITPRGLDALATL